MVSNRAYENADGVNLDSASIQDRLGRLLDRNRIEQLGRILEVPGRCSQNFADDRFHNVRFIDGFDRARGRIEKIEQEQASIRESRAATRRRMPPRF